MAQFSMEIIPLTGSVLRGNQQTDFGRRDDLSERDWNFEESLERCARPGRSLAGQTFASARQPRCQHGGSRCNFSGGNSDCQTRMMVRWSALDDHD